MTTAVLACLPTLSAAAALPPLHATRGADPALLDGEGREVLLRGVNVNQLGDYHQDDPDLPAVIPLTEQDFADIAALGFNHVRLILSWSALEPEPDAFDRDYVSRIRQAVDWAREHDLYVVLDMHQDAWGKHIASPAGERCPPGLSPAIGWDGAPEWATHTDGMTRCRFQLREISPAVAQAFTSFWLDRAGIQTHLIATWSRLAKEFAADPVVAGYDLLNEPHPGWTPEGSNATLLGLFYGRAIAAIRAAERSVPGGFAHPVFFEPNVTWSATTVDLVPPPTFTADENIVFAPHIYAGSLSADGALGLGMLRPSHGFAFAEAVARTYGTTFWSGEWGWFGDPAADRPLIAEYAREEDRRRVGGAWWSWKQACGDPHVIGSPGARPGSVSPSLNRYACPDQVSLGIPESTRRILSRPYPRAAPGRLTTVESDPETGAFTVRGTDGDSAGSCRLDVWVPDDGSTNPPTLAGEGIEDVAVEPRPGGWRVTACASGDYELRRTG